MITYIIFLRALAACLITNSHYNGVYPYDIIANGGLLGDVMFFAVSGFCFANIDISFSEWYKKRLLRIYPAVIIITLFYGFTGLYNINFEDFLDVLKWLFYPTYYHFVESIIVLYVPFYFVVTTPLIRNNIKYFIFFVFVCWILIYLLIYDNSYYHIDNVREPMIKFLFFQSMILGVYFRDRQIKKMSYINKNVTILLLSSLAVFVMYFCSKLIFVNFIILSSYQIINQFLLLLLLYFIFLNFERIDSQLSAVPRIIFNVVNYIAGITLEIYLVQYVIIQPLANIAFFPINWFIITSSIFVAASILHKITQRYFI